MDEIEKPQKAKRNRPKSSRKRSEEEILIGSGSSAKEQTKARFDQLLLQAVDETNQTDGKKKKKRTEESVKVSRQKKEQIQLEKLRKGEGLRKDEDDPALLANIYDPDQATKNEKSNKRRQQELDKKKKTKAAPEIKSNNKGNVNEAYEDEPEDKKTKKKKGKKQEEQEQDEVISDLEKKPAKKRLNHEQSQETAISGKDKPAQKKKKKRKASPRTEEDEQVASEDLDHSEDQLGPSDDANITSDGLETDDSKSKGKKKKKKKAASKSKPEEGAAAEEEQPIEKPKVVIEDQGRIMGVTVHRTDKLKTDFYISHPLVRIHVIDTETGNYVKKQTRERAVTSYYESQNENVDMVLPIMTQPFDFKQQKSTLPVWEELVIFNENFHYLIADDPRVIVFFELLDFMSMNTASHKYAIAKQEGGWHRIAWAFIKLMGANGKPNTDRKVRLQLYQPPLRFRPKGDQVEVFQWWDSGLRIAYPSTLYVTIKGIVPAQKVQPSMRSMFATQQEKGGRTYEDLQRTLDRGPLSPESTRRRNPTSWTRLAGQLCKVPNEMHLMLAAGKKGCSILRFSHDGRSLACGCKEIDRYPIVVYEMPSGKVKGQLAGHYSLVYDLCWSRDDKHLLSASSDGTARVWDTETFGAHEVKLLPHPGYVYTAKYHVKVQKIVATGGFDQIIRVWSLQDEGKHAQLMQELDGHMSHINSLCFDEEGTKMYSGDGLGQLLVWNVFVTDQPSKRGMLKDWSSHSELTDKDMKGIAINHMELHPNGKRLLIHTRDNILRMMDLRVKHVMQRYHGALNYKEKLNGTITPCGTFIIAGSEDSNLYVWNTESSDQVAMFADLRYQKPITCVVYHPHDHLMAMCALGDNEPILIYRFNHKAAYLEAERAALIKSGRPGAPLVWTTPRALHKEEDVDLETTRSKLSTTKEDLRTNEMARLDRITKKLEAVSTMSRAFSPRAGEHPLGVPSPRHPSSSTMMGSPNTTWGSTFDATAIYQAQLQENTALTAGLGRNTPPPGVFSPHASGNLLQSMQQQAQFAAQADYMKQSQAGWRPSFAVVGQPGVMRSPSPNMMGRGAQITLNSSQGVPTLNITAPVNQGYMPERHMQGIGNTGPELKVYALYDYQAQRSDEITMSKGDRIKVLYKENHMWWLGEHESGQQGFFPVNYVTQVDEDVQDDDSTTADIHHGNDSDDGIDTHRKTAAVVSRGGELQFISGTEDSDVESTPKKTKKKTRRKSSTVTMESEGLPPVRGRRKKSRTMDSEA